MSVLQIFRGDELMEEVVLSRAVIGLGRHPQNDVVLDDRSLSRFHARVERRGDRFVVVDCGAQNGVHLNGQRIVGESDLAPDDKITLGRYVAVFRSASAPQRDGTPPKNELKAKNGKHDGKNGHGNGQNGHDIADLEFDELDVEVSDEAGVLDDVDDNATKKARPKDLKKPEPTLVLLYNGMEVSRHAIDDKPVTVGRSKQADVVISLLGLSRKHARITRSGEAALVEDLGSQNGTWVNNQRISGQRKLKHGDLLNFYDYAVLYLEDGSVDVGFPGAGFSQPAPGADDLSSRDTNRAMSQAPAPSSARGKAAARSPAPIADSLVAKHPGAAESELVDLGEGSFLGDEFEAEHSDKASDRISASLLDELPEEEEEPVGQKTKTSTDLVDNLDISADLRAERDEVERAFREAEEFADNATDGDVGRFDEKTSATLGEQGARTWARDEDLLTALSNAPDSVLCTLEVQLGGKAYTQMPLSQTVTRVGTDARCELSLPKSSGLMAWHLTLLHLGGSVVLYRAARSAKIQLGETDLDMAIIKDGDLLDLGKVRIKVRMR